MAKGGSGRSRVLLVDAAINLALGILLLLYPFGVAAFLGVPETGLSFYPMILGGVLFGIGLALVLESRRGAGRLVGLGVGGAILINLCAAVVLAGWLLFGGLDVPLRGRAILWVICGAVLVTAAAEIALSARTGRR